MRIIPVIDILGGQAVAAFGGRRDEYRPLETPWCAGSDPLTLARALRRGTGFDTLYVADLDAIIAGRNVNRSLIDAIADEGNLWLDPGLRDPDDTLPRSARLVAGLETLRGAEALRDLVDRVGPERVVFSLDMNNGRPMIGMPGGWPTHDLSSLVQSALETGVRQVLLLDVGRVGGGRGLVGWAVPLLEHLRDRCRLNAEWYAGGGLRDTAELPALRTAGLAGVLVGSALHSDRCIEKS